jgi:hypothetical protein
VSIARLPTIEDHARARALKPREAFGEAVGGSYVLIRLDERGEHDDPVPWAFGRDPKAPMINWRKPRDDEGVNMNTIRDALNEITPSPDDEATATSLTPPPLVPAARGAATVYVVDVTDAAVSLGRDEEADVIVAERSVSRRHALLSPAGEALALQDLGSSNGTRRNGIELSGDATVELSSGDVVELGDVRLLLLSVDDYWVRLPELAD